MKTSSITKYIILGFGMLTVFSHAQQNKITLVGKKSELNAAVVAKSSQLPVPFATCGDMGAEGGWSAWQGKEGYHQMNSPNGEYPIFFGAMAPAAPRFSIVGPGNDPCTVGAGGPVLPRVAPGFGNSSIRLGENRANGASTSGNCFSNGPYPPPDPLAGGNGCAEQLTYALTVSPQDTNFIYAYALVIENPASGHTSAQAPFAEIYILDQSGDTLPCSYQKYTADLTGGTAPGFFLASCAGSNWPGSPPNGMIVSYKPWTLVGINLAPYIGQTLNVVITNTDCALGGHYCYSYWDFSCGPLSSNPASYCPGQSVSITAPNDPLINYTYQWFQNGSPYTGAGGGTAQTITPTPMLGDTFLVEVQQPSGCNFRVVYVPQSLSINAAFNFTTTCGSMSPVSTSTSPDPQNPINGWEWQFPGGTPSSSTAQNPGNIQYPPASGSYTATLIASTAFGCKDTIQHVFTISGAPTAAFTHSGTCGAVTFTDQSIPDASFNPITGWEWTFPGGTPSSATSQNPGSINYPPSGTYTATLIITTAYGCKDTIQHVVTTPSPPTAQFTPTAPCLGSVTTLTNVSVSPPNDPITAWNWTMPGGTPPSSSSTNASTIYNTAGTHTVNLIVTTQSGCKDTIAQQVTVHQPPIAVFNDTASGCAPLSHSFTDLSVASDGNIVSWSWSFPGGSPTSSTAQNPGPIQYANPGNYGASVSVTTNYGCKATLQLNNIIHVYAWPAAEFCVTPAIAPTTEPVFTFCDLWSSDVVQWSWNFGDNSWDSVNTDPMHSYSATATDNDFYAYNVCVYVQNQYGCWDTVCHIVELLPEFTFYIPNTFTPNGDFINEVFFGKSRGVKEYDIWIFDRWGNQLWTCHFDGKNVEWDKPGKDGMSSACKWDGKVDRGGLDMSGGGNQHAQEDVYVWKVRLTDIFDKKHNYIGHVSIVK